MNRRLSLVAEHLSRKQKVKGSIPLIAFHFFSFGLKRRGEKKGKMQGVGFEPTPPKRIVP